MRRLHVIFALAALVVAVSLGGGCERSLPSDPAAVVIVESEVECDCELSSWVVTGRARHLYLSIDCPEGFEGLDGVVEFTTEAHRRDYVERWDASGNLLAPRVARMTRGHRLYPFLGDGDGDERVEGRWRITAAQAGVLQRDWVWGTPYVLVGTNSNTAMVEVLRAAGIEAPASVVDGAGLLGEFPGVGLGLGELVDPGDRGAVVEKR